eukprot:scaffold117103_cov35-Prasinocladus_malaysianus.AAC.1
MSPSGAASIHDVGRIVHYQSVDTDRFTSLMAFVLCSGAVLLGNICLLANCLCSACFLISVKQMVLRYPSANVTAWSYMFAALLLAAASLATVPLSDWTVPREALGPLTWWVLVVSVVGYCLITWAASVIPASQVSASICLQPFTGTLLGWLVLGEPLAWCDLGALGILLGLGLNISDKETPTVNATGVSTPAVCEPEGPGGIQSARKAANRVELLPLLRPSARPTSGSCGMTIRPTQGGLSLGPKDSLSKLFMGITVISEA